jgi:hypothetical protein
MEAIFNSGIVRTFAIFIGVFCLLELLSVMYPNFPKYPWDVNLEKIGIRLYIPVISAIFLSVILSILIGLAGIGK